MKRAALLSVSDRTGLEAFARGLQSLGYVLLTTSGTAKFLAGVGIATVAIEEYTGQKEILDGRVKTLHPKIHAGLLARRDDVAHMRQIESDGILPIDIAAVNLYPFVKNLSGSNASDPEHMIEFVDVGGPTMIRAAAKNHASVYPVIDPADYPAVLEVLAGRASKQVSELEFRRALAVKVFTQLGYDSLEIARYFSSSGKVTDQSALSPISGVVLQKAQELRYGENPHQQAAFYTAVGATELPWKQLHGKELSYNNLLDFDAIVRIIQEFPQTQPAVVIVKHLNPCGAAVAATSEEALKMAKRCDPRSHFGGIIAFNQVVDEQSALGVKEDFAEIVVAPGFEPRALELLQKNKNIRLLQADLKSRTQFEFRTAAGGYLIQQRDQSASDISSLEVMSDRKPSKQELADLQLAWRLCSHVKSNAIVIVNQGLLIGVGAGQMSRIDSVELAIAKARKHGHTLNGAVAASDAFFPFTDSLETLAGVGVQAVVAPAGAKRDEDVVQMAKQLGISLIFAKDRHFRH
ncbi:MAG: bifunctional phosphoribosylaminoimidazolecarboxamide formyltransferase/IMP cyclohydrolase [Oligoflexia bacterium]|nr:bifunctional phosphoribosylaminoimidazolecarboxamide formyltransferase/IMP cyclohydrolase [Oligoflexia bacterium]